MPMSPWSALTSSPSTCPGSPEPGRHPEAVMRNRVLVAAVVVMLSLPPALWAAEPLPRAKPEQVGLSSERLGRVGRVLNQEIEKGKIPGAVALVARKGRIA